MIFHSTMIICKVIIIGNHGFNVRIVSYDSELSKNKSQRLDQKMSLFPVNTMYESFMSS